MTTLPRQQQQNTQQSNSTLSTNIDNIAKDIVTSNEDSITDKQLSIREAMKKKLAEQLVQMKELWKDKTNNKQ